MNEEEFNTESYLNKTREESYNTEKGMTLSPIPEASKPTPGLLGAVFRKDNTIASSLSNQLLKNNRFNDPEPDYNPLQNIPKGYTQFAPRFLNAKSTYDTEDIKYQIDRELSDSQAIADKPLQSFFIGFIAQALDPSILFPGSLFYNKFELAASTAKSALSFGAAAALATTVQEAGLQMSQETRTFRDGTYNILANTILGASIGTYAGKFLTSPMGKKATEQGADILENGDITPPGFAPAPEGSIPPTPGGGGGSLSSANVLENALRGTTLIGKENVIKAYGGTVAKITPSSRLATNILPSMRLAGQSIFENNWLYKKNDSLTDEQTGQEIGFKPNPIALETRIKTDIGKLNSQLVEYDNQFYKQAGIDENSWAKTERSLLSNNGLTRDEFDDATFYTIVTGIESPTPEVNNAANIVNNYFEEWKQNYTGIGTYAEGMTVRTAKNYFTRYYNIPWIQDPRNRANAEERLTRAFRETNAIVEQNLDAINSYNETLQILENQKNIAKQKSEIKRLTKEIEDLKKQFIESMPEEIFDANWNPRKFIMDDDLIWIDVQNTLDNILNLNEERFSNQFLSRIGLGNKAKPTNMRHLLIPDEILGPMVIRNPRKVLQKFARSMIPNYHITKFAQEMGFEIEDKVENPEGSASKVGAGFLGMAKKELDTALIGATPEQAKRLYDAFNSGKNDIKAGLELLMGLYGNGYNTNDNSFSKFSKALSLYQYTRLMGYMVWSAITDPGQIILKNGFKGFVYSGIQPIIKELKSAKHNKELLQSIGKSIETYIGYRLKSFADQEGLPDSPGKFQKAFEYLTQRYGNVTGMSQWTDLMQWITGNAFIDQVLSNSISYFEKGKKIPNKIMREFLALGITEPHLKILYEQWKKNGGTEDGTPWLNWGAWEMNSKEDGYALGVFQNALTKQVDTTITIPGYGDKPLFMNSDLGRIMLQFKGFGFGATNRMLVGGLQRNDANFYQGVTSLLALGALGYVITSLLKNNEPDLSLEHLALEAVDRSGLLGILMEVPLTLNKLGVLPGFGTSRYQSRNWVDAIGGPSVGAISDVLTTINKIKNSSETPLTVKDGKRIIRLTPAHNMWHLDTINRHLGITDGLLEKLGFENE